MPINRSPPLTATTKLSLTTPVLAPLQHSSSVPNIASEEREKRPECDIPNITQRNKRKCLDLDLDTQHDNQISVFMSEMKTVFLEFKEQQDKKIEKIYTSIEEIKAQNVTIQSTVTFLSQNYDALQDRINQLETQLVTERETNLLHLQKLEDNLEKMERGARSTCVEIRNIPVKPQESKESLAAMVTRIGSLINVPVQVHDVRDIFRTRSKDVDSRPIIVEFTTNLLKEKFIYMQRKFNKENKLSTEHLRLECWLSKCPHLPTIPGYESFQSDFHNQNEGVVVYIKSDVPFIVEYPGVADANCLIVKLREDTALVAIYRSPSHVNPQNFIYSLDITLNSLKTFKTIVLIGDINIDISPINSDKHSDFYLDTLASHGMLPGHLFPTREQRCIDHSAIKSNKSAVTLVLDSFITDHAPVIISCDCHLPSSKVATQKLRIDEKACVLALEQTDFSRVFECDDANMAAAELVNTIAAIVTDNTRSFCIPKLGTPVLQNYVVPNS
ncbi:unnamed protein product [Arctia plantaginis]|uniref:Endonuclease/exonuclease/phosphatase domain-containing protein n=1 Tax=Arctia plantaginis TaxID=874455 RepID=A0A8S1ADD3_ARCPL|nr:unnamed protein product [Arctia plantaginis]